MYHYFIHIYGQIIHYCMIIITFSLSIHQLMDIYVVPTFCLWWIMLLWVFVYTFSVPLGLYLAVELLGHITLCLTYCSCSSPVPQLCLTFTTPWTAARQASLPFTISQSLLKLMSIESVMPSNHLILCHPFLLLPSIFPRIRALSNESALRIRWPKYWSFGFSIGPSNEYSGLTYWGTGKEFSRVTELFYITINNV